MSNTDISFLHKTQAKHLKSTLGLSYHCRTTPLLKATGINFISDTVLISTLDMVRSNLLSPSATSSFYSFLLKCNMNKIAKTSRGRVYKSCANTNNGIVDSARCLLHDFNNVNRSLLNLLMKTL